MCNHGYILFFQPSEMFSDHVSTATDSSFHGNPDASKLETIAKSLSRNIHSSEVISDSPARRARQDSFNIFNLDESDNIFENGEIFLGLV